MTSLTFRSISKNQNACNSFKLFKHLLERPSAITGTCAQANLTAPARGHAPRERQQLSVHTRPSGVVWPSRLGGAPQFCMPSKDTGQLCGVGRWTGWLATRRSRTDQPWHTHTRTSEWTNETTQCWSPDYSLVVGVGSLSVGLWMTRMTFQ